MNIILSTPVRFVIALALGFLVGFERESTEHGQKHRIYAGIRTFTILSLYGFACAWLSLQNIHLAIPVGLVSVAGILLVEYLDKLKHDRVGWTSELSALLVFVTGALTLLTDAWLPLALGLVNTFLLTEKTDLGQFVERLNKAEFMAVVKFLLVTLIILPILPNQDYTSYNLNPTHIWEIVILVSAIGFVGYFLSKQFGEKAGLWLSGILGGIVSSTAVSVAVGRIAQRDPSQSQSALQASILSSAVMYPRMLVLIVLVNPAIGLFIAWKMAALTIIGVILAFTMKTTPVVVTPKPEKAGQPTKTPSPPAQKKGAIISQNPFELMPALIFATLYIVLTVVTELIFQYLGNPGLLGLSTIVGLTDITPYVLSIIHRGDLTLPLINSALIISMMSNTIIKGFYFASLAVNSRKETWIRYGIWTLLHIPFILF